MIRLVACLLPWLLALPVGVLLVQVLAARRPSGAPSAARSSAARTAPSVRMAVLVPAHDESEMIASTVEALRRELAPGDRLLVVADNCADATAHLAAEAGAEVVERVDPSRRGKGHALDFGVRHLAADPPDVLVIVDADCWVSRGTLRSLAEEAAARGRPLQSADVQHPPGAPSLAQRIAAFAWLVKTWVRPCGMRALGLPCGLFGTGMALPWVLAARLPLASSALAEDLELGIAAARIGCAPVFFPYVEVSSASPVGADATRAQRRRWEQGSLSALSRYCLPLLADAVRQRRGDLLALALDLCVPPLALLFMMVVSATTLSLAANYLAGDASALVYVAAVTPAAALAVAVLVAWYRFGRGCLSIWHLAYAPWYAVAKLAMYVSVAVSRRPEWIRTKRR